MPAVVVGGSLNGLGVVRSLARGHMPIYLLETSRNCAAAWSRYCTLVPVRSIDGRGLIDELAALGRRLECRPVLILTSDQSVNSVSAHREEIEPLYRISLPAAELVRALSDKTLFQELAEREGFPVPRGACVTSSADLDLLGGLEAPLILKPADKTLVLGGMVERAVRVATIAEARSACEQMLKRAPSIIVQEWVDGPDTEIFFTLFACDGAGRVLGLFPGRKLVCTPPAVGNTAVGVGAPEMASILADPTMRFIERLGYRGLGSLEFKRDSRTGRCLIIEPTVGRTDWQEELATLCGVNLPLLTYAGELGQQPPAPEVNGSPRAWRESAQFNARLAPGTRMVDGFFRWSDPLPALYHYGYKLGLVRAWHALLRVRGALFPSGN